MNNLIIKNIISFEVDSNTAKEFENLLDELENLGVYMDFIFNIDCKFNKENNKLIHIEKFPTLLSWKEISTKKHHYFKSEVVTVNLESNPYIYSIFSTLYLEKMTNTIYDFYNGPDSIYVSFFVNKRLKEKQDIENKLSNHLSEDKFDSEDFYLSSYDNI